MLQTTYPNSAIHQKFREVSDCEIYSNFGDGNVLDSHCHPDGSGLIQNQPIYEHPCVCGDLPIELWYPGDMFMDSPKECLSHSLKNSRIKSSSDRGMTCLAPACSVSVQKDSVVANPHLQESYFNPTLQALSPVHSPMWPNPPDVVSSPLNSIPFSPATPALDDYGLSDLSNNDGSLGSSHCTSQGSDYFQDRSAISTSRNSTSSVSKSPKVAKDKLMRNGDTESAVLKKCRSFYPALPSPPHSSRTSSESSSNSTSREEPSMYKCKHCNASFRIRGYLTRHMKKHEPIMKFNCPFFSHLGEDEKCHQTGGFSRRDTFKMHMKARHFSYPDKVTRKERINCPGKCLGCGKIFQNNELWIENHIMSGFCPMNLKQTRGIRCSSDMD